MADAFPPSYTVAVRPCTIHAGRFRWDIHHLGQPVFSSPESFATEQDAATDGLKEVERLNSGAGRA
jgi:hypothetical protein